MKFLPFDRFSLISPKTPGELEMLLNAKLASPGLWFFRKPAEPYFGKADSSGFKIRPVIGYRNSFLPIIAGRITPRHDGSRIDVVQRMHVLVMAFVFVWVTFVILIGGPIAFLPDENFAGETPHFGVRLIPVLMLLLMWVLTTGGFWWEARHTKDELKLLFDAEDYSSH